MHGGLRFIYRDHFHLPIYFLDFHGFIPVLLTYLLLHFYSFNITVVPRNLFSPILRTVEFSKIVSFLDGQLNDGSFLLFYILIAISSLDRIYQIKEVIV